MSEYRGFDILDYLIILTKWKKILIPLSIVVLITSYLMIYFFVDEQFESKALIIASENEQSGSIGSLMKSFSSLPVSVPGLSSGVDIDQFTTIIYSRTNLEKIINKFDLVNEYEQETMEETIKVLKHGIEAEETKEGAYEISISDKSPQKAADIINYIVDLLNNTLVELNIAKSRDNRSFMEKRYEEIKTNLREAEDSLVLYQRASGILYAEEQAKTSFEAYSKLEASLAAKQIEYTIVSKLYGEESPHTQAAKIAVEEFESRLNKIKNGKENSGLILALKNLPEKSMQYLRYFRDVEVYTTMLEFIIPLYEQSRFEEQKNIPLLQIIDKGVPAEKKSFPPRTILSLLFTSIIVMMFSIVIIIREKLIITNNPKIILLKQNILGKKTK